jgi:hypothetical protein
MAQEIALRSTSSRVRIRNPWAVPVLNIVTLGIYGAFWWYFINGELSDLGRARRADGLGDSPALSTVAYVAGWFVLIPGIWTIVTTCQRIQRGQKLAGLNDRLNGWIALLLALFTFGLGLPVYMQHNLNKIWRSETFRMWAQEEPS